MTNNVTHSEYKLMIVGKNGVGTSSIVRRMIHDPFLPNFLPRIEDTFRLMKTHKDNTQVLLEFTQASTSYPGLLEHIARRSDAQIAVYDVTRRDSFQYALECIEQYKRVKGSDEEQSVTVFLVGNKTDLLLESETTREVTRSEVAEFTRESNIFYFEVSALLNENIEELVEYMITVLRDREVQQLTDSQTKKKCSVC